MNRPYHWWIDQPRARIAWVSPVGLQWNMWARFWLAVVLFAVVFELTGCAGQTQQDTSAMARDPRVQLMAACQGYVAALNVATAAINADRMSSSNVMRVVAIRDRIGPICSTQDKQTPETALVAVAQATTDLATSVGAK